ncbi:gamma-glutamyl-gamma-aminobutyrate hydrolase family protein, partial [Streptomyces sp. NPDC057062]
MSGRPLIGISTYAESGVRWGVWQLDAARRPGRVPRRGGGAGGHAAEGPPGPPGHAGAAGGPAGGGGV